LELIGATASFADIGTLDARLEGQSRYHAHGWFLALVIESANLEPGLAFGGRDICHPLAHPPCAGDAFENGSLLNAEGA
jgi:hypothetical protein